MLLHFILAALAVLSLAITLWQWLAARRFPLHQRAADTSFAPGITLLKPLKGCDAETHACLSSWLKQDYRGPVQVLFGVASPEDPVCEVVRQVIAEHPQANAQLVICAEQFGPNAKVSSLIHLDRLAQHDHLLVSDADTRVPPDFLAQVIQPLRDPQAGLVCCFYALANASTLAMQLEAVGVNADFWSQVLQSRTLKPIDFALGAVMATRRKQLEELGGFRSLVDYLADDYQLGQQITRRGYRIEICPVVVECWECPQGWREVWAHQLRWARTIRVCQPVPYFFSILGNVTVWNLLFLGTSLTIFSSSALDRVLCGQFSPFLLVQAYGVPFSLGVLLGRIGSANDCMVWLRFENLPNVGGLERVMTDSRAGLQALLAPVKDLLQIPIWALAFLGNTVEWRGQRLRVLRGGKLVPIASKQP